MEQDKKCENCEYFKDLFLISKARYIRYSGFCGFCCNQSVKHKFSPKLCDKWQQKTSIIEKKREDVTKVLKDIRKRLSEIASILKDGEN